MIFSKLYDREHLTSIPHLVSIFMLSYVLKMSSLLVGRRVKIERKKYYYFHVPTRTADNIIENLSGPFLLVKLFCKNIQLYLYIVTILCSTFHLKIMF